MILLDRMIFYREFKERRDFYMTSRSPVRTARFTARVSGIQRDDWQLAPTESNGFPPEARGNDAPSFMIDGAPQKLPGGNGLRADWNIAREIARDHSILLAGGLNVDNVTEAIEFVQPWGVDVSSGVERAPGLKDHSKVRQFIDRVKAATVEVQTA